MSAPFAARMSSRTWFGVRFLCIVVALNAPSWLTAWIFQAPLAEERPLFNLDLLAAAALACVSTLAGGAALVLAWAADFIRLAAKNYHFMSALDFVDAARFVDMLNLQTFLSASVLGLALGFVTCVWLVLWLTRSSVRLVWPLMSLAALVAVFDVSNGSFHIFGLDKDSRVVNMNFAGSPGWNVWRSERQSLLAAGPLVPMRQPKAFQALQGWQATHPGRTSMLVLVESMGLPRDPALQVWLKERLATPRVTARWDIQMTDEEFVGATTSGELRTLCGLQGHYSRLDDTMASGCLPRRLASRGVTSIGIHGFGLRMFDRAEWWPKIGLTPWHWPAGGAPMQMNCNRAFPGVCDSALLEQAMKQAQTPGRFIYALTLDTHLPLDLRQTAPLPAALRSVCAASATPEQACQLVNKLGDLLALLESTLAASETTPFLVVVGDHMPPFGEVTNREAFIAHRVPMFVMTPR
ncbi:sulfatase-like hydrolase/transferase [Aquincola sp. MAHUQ-54]|uniref:Sulfatase-like hydrolase/transferase n=1 Tax=Aquincola agrisoli TaxID=3119538 RepID=A0AAW9QEC3_9BURK